MSQSKARDVIMVGVGDNTQIFLHKKQRYVGQDTKTVTTNNKYLGKILDSNLSCKPGLKRQKALRHPNDETDW